MGILSSDQGAPARSWKAIVLDANLSGCRAIYVGGAGNISMTGDDGNTEVFTGLLAGQILPCGPRKVNTTSTTATLLLGLY
jgi:hypothetical protein